MEIEQNVQLKQFTTFKVGGNADYFCRVSSADELKEAVNFSKENNLPIFALGGGSNILISDDGFSGLVIRMEIKGISFEEKDKDVFITAGAGESWDNLVQKCISNNIAGIECLSGVPGTVGAAPIQNIACYGQSVDKVISGVNAINITTGEEIYFSNRECDFRYRNSFFKTKKGKGYIITHVEFIFNKEKKPSAEYKDYKYSIADYFKNKKNPPALSDIRNAVMDIRNKKGMIINRQCKPYKSAGSFFSAPIVSNKMFEYVKNVAGSDTAKMKELEPWHWTIDSRKVKIAPAFLMEYTDFKKGYMSGNVGISPKHSLAIINLGKANASDIFKLSQKIKKEIYKKFKIKLENEVNLIGNF